MAGAEGLARAALFDAKTGLGADELRAELLALQIALRAVVGCREDPDPDKRHGDGEQRRIFIREDRRGVAKHLHPDGRAEDHQHHGGEQAEPAASSRRGW